MRRGPRLSVSRVQIQPGLENDRGSGIPLEALREHVVAIEQAA